MQEAGTKPTEVFVWSSYSCNNSSDYRLVAEFATPKAAQAMRQELVKFFAAHAKEYDKQSRAEDFDWPGEATDVARTFGKKFGHEWSEFLIWGEQQLAGDEPEVAVVGKDVVLYHGYSSGGFGPDVPRVLERAGGKLLEKEAQDGPPVLVGSFARTKSGSLEKALATYFDQRLGPGGMTEWKKPKWLPGNGAGKVEDVTFVLAEDECTFTVPIVAENIEPFRTYLESYTNKLTLRLASGQDVAKNRAREERIAEAAAKTGVGPKPVLEQMSRVSAAAPPPRKGGQLGVYTVFHNDKRVNGADDLVIGPSGIVGFAGDDGRTQRLVTADCKKRTVSNITFPRSWLQGVSIDADGSLRAGGEKGRIYVSTDEGKTWKEEKAPGLAKALGPTKRIWSICRFEGELWAAGEGGVARTEKGTWRKVVVPASLRRKKRTFYAVNVYLPRLVVTGGVLYVLEAGIARWDGKKLVSELAPEHDVNALTATATGTLIAAGDKKLKDAYVVRDRTVWRKPPGGTWTALDNKAIDVAKPTGKARYSETFKEVVCVDGDVVLVGSIEDARAKLSAVRISKDDGKTFKRMKVVTKGYVLPTAAIADGRGGVLVAGQEGVLLRVARDGIGAWSKTAKAHT